MEIINRGDARGQIGFSDLRRRGGNASGCPVGMEVNEAGQEGLAVGLDNIGSARCLDIGPNASDPAIGDDHVGLEGSRSGAIEHGCAHNGDRVGWCAGCRRAQKGECADQGKAGSVQQA
ncbi:MAG: hypothetical protein RLZZ141_1510 [Pseudomonadota bacterium]